MSFDAGEGQLTVQINGAPAATYRYEHDEIKRPVFANVQTPSGIGVTRAHPPEAGQDLTDHGTYHPGIWMSFGAVSWSDYWRLKASVRHAEFVEQPRGETGEGSLAVRLIVPATDTASGQAVVVRYLCGRFRRKN